MANEFPRVAPLEIIYTMIALLFLVGVFNPLLFGTQNAANYNQLVGHVSVGNRNFQILSGSIYLIAIFLLFLHYHKLLYIIKNNWALFVFILFILISGFWADYPETSFRRSLALTGTTAFAVYAALRFQQERLLGLLAIAFAVLIVESTFIALVIPRIGVSSFHTGAWQGAVGHKNDFGRVMALALLLFWVVSERAGRYRPQALVLLVLSGLLVFMSLSRGAWVVVMAMCLAIPILKFLRESDGNFSLRFIFLAVVVGTFVTAYLLPNLEWLLLLLGRDLSLTGRTDIWELAVEAGWDRPILGAGYRSFWTLLSNTLRWGHGHNSFLDLWLELGFVGLGLFLVVIAIAIRRAVYHMKSEPGRLGLWPMIFLVYMLLSGTVTNTFPNHGTITWTLLVATCLYLSSAAAERARSVSPRRVPLGSLT